MFVAEGIIQHFIRYDEYKIWLLIDDEIGKYYKSLIPIKTNKPLYPTHISIYRGGKIPNMPKWGSHEGYKILFEYDGTIHNDNTYWWLEAKCPALEEIRVKLGLSPVDDITYSPDKKHPWHITIANNKNVPG